MKPKTAHHFLHNPILHLIFHCIIFSTLQKSAISAAKLIIKDPETLTSPKNAFKLGFFTPANTTNRYLGIFFAFSEETVIWVANRATPIKDFSGEVTLSDDGNLILTDSTNQTLFSTNLTSPTNSTVQILDTGNLVILNSETGETTWESFNQPTDYVVSGMTLSQNVKTGKTVALSAWKTATDPEFGSFTAGLGALPIPQLFAWDGGRPHWRSGPWNGLIFLGIKEMFYAYLDGFTQVKNDSAGNFFYSKTYENIIITASVNSSGYVMRKMWDGKNKRWDLVWAAPGNECDIYGKCGEFGVCNSVETPICSCLRGFEPTNGDEWERGNWTNGCRRKELLQCDGDGDGEEDGFVRLEYMKVPDFAEPFSSKDKDECRRRCLRNCSCIAYAYDLNIGCMFWSGSLIDSQKFDRVGVDLYLRLSASELGYKRPTVDCRTSTSPV